MAEDLEQSQNADELQAAESFKAMLAALPETAAKTKNPADPEINGVSAVWRTGDVLMSSRKAHEY